MASASLCSRNPYMHCIDGSSGKSFRDGFNEGFMYVWGGPIAVLDEVFIPWEW